MRNRSKLAPFVCASALLALLAAGPAQAALDGYVTIVGATQGTFVGSVDVDPFVGKTAVHEFHHLIERPAGAGATEHQTAILTVELADRAVPQILTALDTGELLTVTLLLQRPTGTGAEETYMTITLTNAKAVSVEPLSPDNLDPDLLARPATVRVRFAYGSIAYANAAGPSATLSNP